MNHVASPSLMRRLNRSAILNLIRLESPIARTRIAHRLGMSLPTVMRAVDELIDDDLVTFEGSEPSGGRRRPLLRFNGEAYAVVAVDLGGSRMRGMVANLDGKIVHELAVPSGGLSGRALEELCQLIDVLVKEARPAHQHLRGIVVGAPGVTLTDTGTVVWAPSLGWQNLPLRDLLSERFDSPVFVENDVNLAALGEYGFGSERGVDNLVCISIGTGIGAGIILEGKLYRGHHQAAGEVGYFVPGVQHLGRRYDDDFGALETYASGMGIARRARELQAQDGSKAPARDLTTEEVFELARTGEGWAVKLIDEVVDYLALMIAGVSALLDPEEVILSGGVARSADMLVEPLKKRLDGIVPFVPRIKVSELGTLAVTMGAIMMVLDATTGHIMVGQRI